MRALCLSGQKQWASYAKGELEATHGPKPDDLLANPARSYADKGWSGWGDFLGTGKLVGRPHHIHRSFREARKFVRALGLSGQKQWFAYAKGELEATHGLRPNDIPGSPVNVYKDKGWSRWGDWLGTGELGARPKNSK